MWNTFVKKVLYDFSPALPFMEYKELINHWTMVPNKLFSVVVWRCDFGATYGTVFLRKMSFDWRVGCLTVEFVADVLHRQSMCSFPGLYGAETGSTAHLSR